VKLYLIMGVLWVACFMCLTADSRAQHQPTSTEDDSVKTFLRSYLSDRRLGDDRTTRYFSAFVNLNDDPTKEVIVYLTGGGRCGTGGCTTLILALDGSSYRVVTKITVSRPPIRILSSKTNGWHDISVWVQGGGIQPGYEAELSFDGKTYPSNPSVPPAKPLSGKAAGEVVISTTEIGIPIYQ
jgi:hypothetical protein